MLRVSAPGGPGLSYIAKISLRRVYHLPSFEACVTQVDACSLEASLDYLSPVLCLVLSMPNSVIYSVRSRPSFGLSVLSLLVSEPNCGVVTG
jgi:hypothetical protein